MWEGSGKVRNLIIDEAKSHKKFITLLIIRCTVDKFISNKSVTLRITHLLPANLEISKNV